VLAHCQVFGEKTSLLSPLLGGEGDLELKNQRIPFSRGVDSDGALADIGGRGVS